MAKSYKLKDDNYIDSTGIVHSRKKLSEILNYKRISPIVYNSIQLVDENAVYQIGKLVIVNLSLRNNNLLLEHGTEIVKLPKPIESKIVLGIMVRGDTGAINAVRFRLGANDGVLKAFYPSTNIYLGESNQPRIFTFSYLSND